MSARCIMCKQRLDLGDEVLDRVCDLAVELVEAIDDPRRARPHLIAELREALRDTGALIAPVGVERVG